MRKSIRIVGSLMMVLALTLGTTTIFKADTTTKEDVSVEITTDKESYSSGDKVLVVDALAAGASQTFEVQGVKASSDFLRKLIGACAYAK
jgi:hypothetical protein